MTPAIDSGIDAALTAALSHPHDGDALALLGPPGSGKTVALVQRARRAAATKPRGAVLLTAPSDAGVARLRAHAGDADDAPVCATFGQVAFEVLHAAAGADHTLERIHDARAAIIFEGVGAELFSLEWDEFAIADIDPEITGLRAPERFADAAFRLIRKLRSSLVSPEDFKRIGLQGATTFYGHPPNLAGADLLMATKERDRDSLRVSPAELERQRTREVDLVRVLARLYSAYVDSLVKHGCMTDIDAVYEATLALHARPEVRDATRRRFSYAAIDDAQDLTGAQLAFLGAIFGEPLRGVTFAGDPNQATCGFATGARGSETLKRAPAKVVFERHYRSTPAIERAALLILSPAKDSPACPEPVEGRGGDDVQLYRAGNAREEARYIAGEVAKLIANGTAPARIAVITRNLRCAGVYTDALLARDVPIDVAGATSLFDFPVVLDALAALWSAVNPFRHDYLLRNLEAPWLRLSDASIAELCSGPPDSQPLLFALPEEAEDEARAARWDAERDLRLGRNVTRGDVDAGLEPQARERLVAFRRARERWEASARKVRLGALARTILEESVLATLPPGARGRFERGLVARLTALVDAFAARDPLAGLDDFLAYAEKVAAAETDLLGIAPHDPGAVAVLDVEAAKGNTYDAVFLPDLRAGAWPRYYVPDAFLFSPTSGMIPKDNVGDAGAARTAKFTYSLYQYKFRDKYNSEERRAFYCAATRARRFLFCSASGNPTKGVAAPEILANLEKQL
jgi:superfamily I DNA/RNA helicase